jgi:hypothetical protein
MTTRTATNPECTFWVKRNFGQPESRHANPTKFPTVLFVMSLTVKNDWVKTILFDRGYLSKIRGDAIKVYLAIIEAAGGLPDRSVTISLSLLMRRTHLSCPTVIESLARLEELGLVVSTTHQRGKVKTYYVSNPPPENPHAPAATG